MQHLSLTRVVGPLALTTLTALWWAGCSDTAGPRWVQTVKAVPDSAHLAPGETAVFGARLLDQNGNEFPEEWLPRVEWSNMSPSRLTLVEQDVGVAVTAVELGVSGVRAELGRGRATVPVYVHPPGLARIEIEVPSPPIVSIVSGRMVAYAHLFDASGEEIDPYGFRLSWKVADTTIARISNSMHAFEFAIVWGRQAGQTRLRLIVGDTTVSKDLIVIREPLPPGAPWVNTLSSTSLEVIWGRASGANLGYRLHRSMSAGGTYTHIATTGSGAYFAGWDTTYVDKGLSPSTTYFYQVEACHHAEGCSEQSAPGSGTTASGG